MLADAMDYQLQSQPQQQQQPQDIFLVAFLDKASALLRQLKDVSQHVFVCRAQINQIHDRCTALLEALRSDSPAIDGPALVKATDQIEALFQKILAKVCQIIDYGRPKSFIMRRDLAAHLEGLNIDIEKCASSFEKKRHPTLHQWQMDHHKASLRDETEAFHLIGDLLQNPAQRKAIMAMGKNAVASLRQTIEIGSLAGQLTQEQRQTFNKWLDQVQ